MSASGAAGPMPNSAITVPAMVGTVLAKSEKPTSIGSPRYQSLASGPQLMSFCSSRNLRSATLLKARIKNT